MTRNIVERPEVVIDPRNHDMRWFWAVVGRGRESGSD